MIASGEFGTEVLIHRRIHNMDCLGVGLNSLNFFPALHVGQLRVGGSDFLQRLLTQWILLDLVAANNKLNCGQKIAERARPLTRIFCPTRCIARDVQCHLPHCVVA